MSVARRVERLTEEEYLALERRSEVRHEFVDGQVYAMSGASLSHVRIAGSLSRHVGNHLAGTRCEVLNNDMKVRTPRGTYRYPDMIVECHIDDRARDPYFTEAPTLLVEVISTSSRRTDESKKPLEYFNIPSLQEYVLIEQDFVKVQVLRRSQHWRADTYFLGDSIRFDSIDLDLPVEDVYERVETGELKDWRERDADGE